MIERGEHAVQYQEPFYSNRADAPLKPRSFAGMEFNIPVLDAESSLKPFVSHFKGIVSKSKSSYS